MRIEVLLHPERISSILSHSVSYPINNRYNMANSEGLNVFWDERLVGRLSATRTGRLRFCYSPTWLTHPDALPVSFSLPLQSEEFGSEASTNFFENILPEEDARDALAQAAKLNKKDVFSFLKKFGRECAGALIILPEDEVPLSDDAYEDVTKRLGDILRERTVLGTGVGLVAATGARLSLAGAQDKLPVRYEEGRFYLPVRYAATTHIIKPENFRFHGLAVNEFFCMRLARCMGLPVPEHHIVHIDDIPLYMSQRFDRKIMNDGRIRRIHQEDFCQALGVNNVKKYEEHGGPGFRQCKELITAQAFADASETSLFFVKAAIMNYLIGNNDAHAKNFSILRLPQPSLAPLYDLVSTEIYPGLDTRVSMAIGGRFIKKRIDAASWKKFASDVDYDQEEIFNTIKSMAENALEKLPEVLIESAAHVPEKTILQRLGNCVERNAEALLKFIPVHDEEESSTPRP